VPSDPIPTVTCDVSALAEADAGTVDALARLHLDACRSGVRIRFCQASAELEELVEFMGLSEALLGVEPRRKAEEREDGVGVEEERELDDPAV
jgi:hypothetical protein